MHPFDSGLRKYGLRPPADIEMRHVEGKQRGVFALREFAAGEIVEIAPVVLLQIPEGGFPLSLRVCSFNWQDLGGHGGSRAFALGYGTFYNGANPANMRFEAVLDGYPFLRFIAVRRIAANEELTVNYSGSGGAAESDNNWWFEEHQTRML